MIGVRVSNISPDDPISSFPFKSLLYIFVCKFPESFTACDSKEQIVLIVACYGRSVFRRFWIMPKFNKMYENLI